MIKRHTLLRVFEEIAIQVFSLEFGTEIEREVAVNEFSTVSMVAIQSVQFTKGIMHGGVEGASDDERAKFWNRLRKIKLPRNFFSCL